MPTVSRAIAVLRILLEDRRETLEALGLEPKEVLSEIASRVQKHEEYLDRVTGAPPYCIEIDAASSNGVDDVRALQQTLQHHTPPLETTAYIFCSAVEDLRDRLPASSLKDRLKGLILLVVRACAKGDD